MFDQLPSCMCFGKHDNKHVHCDCKKVSGVIYIYILIVLFCIYGLHLLFFNVEIFMISVELNFRLEIRNAHVTQLADMLKERCPLLTMKVWKVNGKCVFNSSRTAKTKPCNLAQLTDWQRENENWEREVRANNFYKSLKHVQLVIRDTWNTVLSPSTNLQQYIHLLFYHHRFFPLPTISQEQKLTWFTEGS